VTKGQSRHEEIAAGIRERIQSGALKPGDRAVASLDTAAHEHQVAVGTIREALRLLASEGLVMTRPGIGTIVQDPAGNSSAPAGRDGELWAAVRKLQGDVADTKGDLSRVKAQVAQIQGRKNMDQAAARKRARSDEQSG
jgi:DNA-binding FadR family transcriptional regulator